MPLDREALMQRLMASFREEAAERLAILDSELVRWRSAAPGPAALESAFREVHSLKGAARAVGQRETERICHAWESVLHALNQGRRPFRPEMAPVFAAALQMLQRNHAGETPDPGQVERMCERLAQFGEEAAAAVAAAAGAAAAVAAAAPPAQPEAVSVEPATVEPATAESLPAAPIQPSAPPAAAEPAGPQPADRPAAWRSQTIRVRAEQCEELAYHGETLRQSRLQLHDLHRRSTELRAGFQRLWQRRLQHEGLLTRLRDQLAQGGTPDREAVLTLLEWQDWGLDRLAAMQAEALALDKLAGGLDRELGGLDDAYARTVEELLQLPCRGLLDEMPALVADLAGQTGKAVELKLPNTALRVDKRILDALRTPLMHLLRNAVDHGIEPPERRRAAGKPPVGTLRIDIGQASASHFTLTLEDDGAGIDTARLRQQAEERGVLPRGGPALPPEQLLPLVFESGLSTRRAVSTLSGRGEGLAIVREAIEQLGGSIAVASTPGLGCRFALQLPLNRSTFRVVLVRVAEALFAVPASAIDRTLRLPAGELIRREGRSEVMVEGLDVPLRSLAGVLDLAETAPGAMLNLLVLGSPPQQIALRVDALLGDQEITLKPLGKQLRRVRNLLGATVLGDGTLVPVLHPQDLYRSSLQAAGLHAAAAPAEPPKRQPRILVADDSFTSRGLLRALLETAGYQVQTVNDGLEAWNALRQGEFDLLVSDIEMPRMDGFSLTARLRADRGLAELPVVLVTALHSAEDRARGLEVGANAYLVKGGLETDTVLAAVKRLL
ncbi:hybrid sensor histidine kinase/response regulator [Chitinimonas koreensis]|uniref:hybrid sensor histidine kinase/response regulator n=1 Tax=Chitinimonas koreensis TaxID=356302 RepID=UPI0004146DE0|nr:response regulator [Chitinimonas koreensis]QNM97542.1 response regulator [Chitinimonas koreensis]